jgi:hypothetical protein
VAWEKPELLLFWINVHKPMVCGRTRYSCLGPQALDGANSSLHFSLRYSLRMGAARHCVPRGYDSSLGGAASLVRLISWVHRAAWYHKLPTTWQAGNEADFLSSLGGTTKFQKGHDRSEPGVPRDGNLNVLQILL